ncbi:unnamed protein product [Orchesella dallaii]|uniref:Uncharacterized protein n=1 Tax=Orchesella dallaii TaxID=48710 RepID=A0ABP1S7Z8_9HEXA
MEERRNNIGGEVPGEIRQDENEGNRRRNQAEIREYAAMAREMAVHQAGQRLCHNVMMLLKILIFILITLLLSYVLNYEWIPKMFVVLIMIGTGLRFCWWQWIGKEVVIRVPVG